MEGDLRDDSHHLHGHFHGRMLKNLSDEEIAKLPERERLIYEHQGNFIV